jgi:hypothetical protein
MDLAHAASAAIEMGGARIAAALLLATGAASRRATPPNGWLYETSPGRNTSLPTVWLVPHSHQDLGWRVTVDKAFSGVDNSVYHANIGR